MIHNPIVTLIFNTIQNYKRQFQAVLTKHIDNLHFHNEEERESFSTDAAKVFRSALQKLIRVSQQQSQGEEDELVVLNVRSLLEAVFHAVSMGKLKLSVVLTFIDDIFECLSVKSLRSIFEVLESYVSTAETVEPNDQNMLLRMINTMLKRISKAQDIEFRGRLHIALCKMLKLCHESGLKGKSCAGSSVLLDEEQNFSYAVITHKFYQQFWALQKYFNDPNELATEAVDPALQVSDEQNSTGNDLRPSTTKLRCIEGVITDILRIFTNSPVKPEGHRSHQSVKYLTRASLLETQLQDSYFRKLFLTQALFFCSNLTNTATKSSFALRDDEKQIVTNIEKKVSEGLTLLSTSLGEEPLSSKLSSLLQNEKNWIDIKQNYRERKKTLVQPISQQTLDQLAFYRANEQTADEGKRNMYNELLNPRCKKVYDRQLQIAQEMKDKMKTEGCNFQQFMEETAKRKPLSTEPLQPSFEYYFNEASSALRNFEEKGNLTENFESDGAYMVFEWKAMKSLYRESIKDGLVDRKDNSKLREYRLLSAVHKKQQELKALKESTALAGGEPTKKAKTDG